MLPVPRPGEYPALWGGNPREAADDSHAEMGHYSAAAQPARARAAGHRICEVPVRHYPRTAGAPTGANLKVIRKAFRELWDLRKELR